MKQIVIIVSAIILIIGLIIAVKPAVPDPVQRLRLPAAGRQMATFTITSPGRYAVAAQSDRGTALRIVDHVSGPGPWYGAAGERDGRVDRFFDTGTYRLVTDGHAAAAGEITVEIRLFTEMQPESSSLPEGWMPASTLADYTCMSRTVVIDHRRWLYLEAAGRSLNDMRLWLPGGWMHPGKPWSDTILADTGRPLRHFTMSVWLEPGVYTLTLYGGPPLPWSRDDGGHPLYLRSGIPELPEAGLQSITGGPFGVRRYRLPGAATFIQATVPETAPVTLESGEWHDDNPFRAGESCAVMTEKSRRPVIAINRYHSTRRPVLITVRTAPDQPVDLQFFPEFESRSFEGRGPGSLVTLHTGDPRDHIDATMIITRSAAGSRDQSEVFRAFTIDPGPGKLWRRRFSLNGTATLYLHLDHPGEYRVEARGTPARFRFEPFLTSYPRGYEAPRLTDPGVTRSLEAGYIVMTIVPVEYGIIEMAIFPADVTDFTFDGDPPDLQPIPLQPRCMLDTTDFAPDRWYRIYLNRQPEVTTGLSIHWNASKKIAGDGTGKKPAAPPTPAPYPKIHPGETVFFDLQPGESRIFVPVTDREGLYQLFTMGLLDTAGRMRTRMDPAFRIADTGGSGRNFRIQDYLDASGHQLTVSSRKNSHGHLGLTFRKSTIVSGGDLTGGRTGRITLNPDQAALYTFTVRNAGKIRIDSRGRHGPSRCRLEDAEGWPVTSPGRPADFTIHLAAGDYRLLILPDTVRSRRLTRIAPVEVTPCDGVLVPGRTCHAVWMEPGPGETREPDLWTFAIPAAVNAVLTISPEMTGLLRREGSSDPPSPLAGFSTTHRMQPGRYRAEIVSRRPDNHRPYTIRLDLDTLVAGMSRTVDPPAVIPVAVGPGDPARTIRIGSTGDVDVRGTLLDAAGNVVAVSNDRPDDWNFLICRSLPVGIYRLDIQAVSGAGSTTVFMNESAIRTIHIDAPSRTDILPGDDQVMLIIPVPANAPMITITAESRENLLMTMKLPGEGTPFRKTGKQTICRVPGVPGSEIRLKILSLDRRGIPATITVSADAAVTCGETASQHGGTVGRMREGEILAVALRSPGVFRITGDDNILAAAMAGEPCRPVSDNLLAAADTRIWLASSSPKTAVTVKRVRLRGGRENGLTLTLHDGSPVFCDLETGKGPAAITAASHTGIPGLRILPAARYRSFHPDSGGMVLTGRTATAISSGPEAMIAAIWNADPAAKYPMTIHLTLQPEKQIVNAERGFGVMTETVPAGTPLRLQLPPGPKEITLELPRHVAATLSCGTSPGSIHRRPDPFLPETVFTDATRLTFYPLSGEPAVCRVTVMPDGREIRSEISPDHDLEMYRPSPGILNVRVKHNPAGGDMWFEPGSGVVNAVFYGENGRVTDAAKLMTGNGLLKIRHDAGLLSGVLRVSESAGEHRADPAPSHVVTVPLPARLSVSGRTRWIRIDQPDPCVVTVTAACPVIMEMQAGEHREIRRFPGAGQAGFFLPHGTGRLRLHSPAGGALFGEITLTGSPAAPIPAPDAPERVLLPGDMAAYRFHLPAAAVIGIGIRTNSPELTATVLTTGGQPIARGISMMPALDAGDYFLVISLPGGGPAEYLPVITGLHPPPPDPPDTVIRRYRLRSSAASAPNKEN